MKKIYIAPEMVVMLLDTEELMRASQPSDTPTPPGTSAPVRREVF